MKRIRHSKLPIVLECNDHLDINMLQAIDIHMTAFGWDKWIDEYGYWFDPYYIGATQLELFDDV